MMTSPPSRLSLRANFSWTFVGNVVNAACWFAMTIVLAKLGSPAHVGQFALGLAVTAPIFMFCTLRLRDVQAIDAKQEYRFGDYLAVRIVTTVLAIIVTLGIVLVSGYERETMLVILATGLSKSVESLSDATYGLFMQHERLDRIAKSKMMKGVLALLGLSLGFALTGSVFVGVLGVMSARVAILVTYDLRNAILSLNHTSKLGDNILPKSLLRPHWDFTILKKLIWLALPLGFVQMLISLNVNIPNFFIEGHLGAHYLGLFAAVAAFQKTAPTVVAALGHSASPRLAKYYAANDARAYRKLTSKLIGLGAALGIAGVLVSVVFGRQILTLFYGPEYALPTLFGLVMFSAGMNYVATMLLYAVTSAKYFKIQLPINILSFGTTTASCFWLIPLAGLNGAAIALILGNVVRVVGSMIAVMHAQRALDRRTSMADFCGLGGDFRMQASGS